MATEEERIALFLDYENLAIGAREELGGVFDIKPVSDALAERGRVVVRRAYADWSGFDDDRRMLTNNHVELIEMTQGMGAARKNAADLKLAVDAMELAFERDYVTTFVIASGDSDFTPLVHKLRELNRRVIGVGVKGSTSKLLPPACDEFLFYENLEGVDASRARRRRAARAAAAPSRTKEAVETAPEPPAIARDEDLAPLVTQTLAGLQRSTGGAVLSSMVKRALLRKDPTFSESDYGFRSFGELMRHLEERKVVELSPGAARGDPEVGFPAEGTAEDEAFDALRAVVAEISGAAEGEGYAVLSGLKDRLRRVQPEFSEKKYGFNGFLQFCKAARTRGYVELDWDDEVGDYLLTPAAG